MLLALVRWLGAAATIVVAGLAFVGTPAHAQLPPLLFETTTTPPTNPATTTIAGAAATTTTLLALLPTNPLPLPAPTGSAPPSAVAPVPTTAAAAAAAKNLTVYKPPPIPPSTPPRPLSSGTKVTKVVGTTTTTLVIVEPDTGFGAELPFDAATQSASAQNPSGSDTVELGIEESAHDKVGKVSSIAAGLLALALSGLALSVRSAARRIPLIPT